MPERAQLFCSNEAFLKRFIGRDTKIIMSGFKSVKVMGLETIEVRGDWLEITSKGGTPFLFQTDKVWGIKVLDDQDRKDEEKEKGLKKDIEATLYG